LPKLLKVLAFGCTHFPLQDDEAISRLLEEISAYKPDVLAHLGDGHEADAASKFPSEYKFTLKHEFEQHNKFLRSARLAAPKNCRRIFLPGNHDENILAPCRIDGKLRDLCDWRLLETEFADKHWQIACDYSYDRKKGCVRIGQVTLGHGYEAGQNADEFHSILLGVPYGLYVGAHLHRGQEPTRAYRTKGVPLPYHYMNVGCLRDLKPEFVKRKRTHQWSHGCAKIEVADIKSPRVSREWSAELVSFRRCDDDL
jgi:hypothetical protein